MMPTSRTAASSPARTRPAAVGDAGVSEIISACSSTSRAVTRPEAGTRTSRGHALLQEHPLDHLGLGLVGRADDADELPLAELRLDLPYALTERVVLPRV